MQPFWRAILSASLCCCAASLSSATDYFVNATASAPGNGTTTHPFPTIQQGADAAQPGDTVIIQKGIYREEVKLHHGGTPDRPLTLRAEIPGSVILDGADPISGFMPDTDAPMLDAAIWTCSTYHSPYRPMDNNFGLRDAWMKEGPVGQQQVELCSRNDMVWLDGHFLRQVDATRDLRAGTFFVDRTNGTLSISLPVGNTPNGHLIETAQRGTLLDPDAHVSYVHLRGLHFTRGAVGYGKALVNFGTYYTEGWVAEDNTADWSSWAGIHAYGGKNRILRNIAADNGDEGIGGILHDSLLDENASLRNNWKGIRDTFHSGGGKFTESNHVIVRRHEASGNIGPGLWFDIDNHDITVEQGRFHHNKYAGIFMEISPGPIVIRDNACWANAGAGIVIGESSNIRLENNICAANWFGIDLRNLPNRHGKFGDFNPAAKDPALQLSNVTLRGNILLNNSCAGIANTSAYLDPVAEKIDSDHNIFWNNTPLWWRAPDPKTSIPTPPFVTATLRGYWILDSMDALKKFGLDTNSEWRDPQMVNSDMYQFPASPP